MTTSVARRLRLHQRAALLTNSRSTHRHHSSSIRTSTSHRSSLHKQPLPHCSCASSSSSPSSAYSTLSRSSNMDTFLRSLTSILPSTSSAKSSPPSSAPSTPPKRSSPARSFSNMLLQTAVKSVTNGLMQHDDYYVHGLPAAKFSLTDPSSPSPLPHIFSLHSHIDPFTAASVDLSTISSSISSVIGSDHPILNQIAHYFFDVNGKRIRPTIILLMARALNRGQADDSSPPPPELNGKRKSATHRDELDDLLPEQHRLAEIAEMMHTASLLHDDVIDEGQQRRGVATVNAQFGNKFAILGGDFLLSRASVSLARLRNHDVTELMSMIIEHLVKGEILQLKSNPTFTPSSSSSSSPSSPSSSPSPSAPSPSSLDAHLSRYLTKTYYKTASLIANSCHSVSILGSHSPSLQTIAYEYGRSLGLAFQVVDDVLDIVGDEGVMGKKGGWDLTHGVVTAPVLYAMEMDGRVRERVMRGVGKEEGEEVRRMVVESGGVERARRLAEELGENAVAAAMKLKPSVPRSALINLVQIVLNRQK